MKEFGYGLGGLADFGEMGYMDDLAEPWITQRIYSNEPGNAAGMGEPWTTKRVYSDEPGNASGMGDDMPSVCQPLADQFASLQAAASQAAANGDDPGPLLAQAAQVQASLAQCVSPNQSSSPQASSGPSSTTQALNFAGSLFGSAAGASATILPAVLASRNQARPGAPNLPYQNPLLVQQPRNSNTAAWVVGGIAVVGILGLAAFALTRQQPAKKGKDEE